MSNHSSEMDPELVGLFMDNLKNQSLEDQFDKISQGLQLGPTGQFPEGKLTEHDEGEIKIAITDIEDKVVINFGSPVTWIGFTPELAEGLAQSLLEKAARVRSRDPRKNGKRAINW